MTHHNFISKKKKCHHPLIAFAPSNFSPLFTQNLLQPSSFTAASGVCKGRQGEGGGGSRKFMITSPYHHFTFVVECFIPVACLVSCGISCCRWCLQRRLWQQESTCRLAPPSSPPSPAAATPPTPPCCTMSCCRWPAEQAEGASTLQVSNLSMTHHVPATAQPLPSHCPAIAQPLPPAIAQPLPSHCSATAPSHCPATARPLPGHCPPTAHPLTTHCPPTARPLPSWVIRQPPCVSICSSHALLGAAVLSQLRYSKQLMSARTGRSWNWGPKLET